MKFRIVEFDDGNFSLQHRRLFMWFDETHYVPGIDVSFPVYYKTKEEALAAYNKKIEENKKAKVIKKWEICDES